MNIDDLDGRIGDGWGGVKPNGSHVNVVLAARGSATFAAAVGMFAQPSPGHTPVLVCVGPDEASYEPVWPPTLMMNKATARDERHETRRPERQRRVELQHENRQVRRAQCAGDQRVREHAQEPHGAKCILRLCPWTLTLR